MIEPLRVAFEVACDPAHAFSTWTERASMWWPPAHSVSHQRGARIVFEPRVGGRIFERTGAGQEHEWGEVTAWDPPHRLAYLWHIATDRANATDVEIRFVALAGNVTRVEVEHGGWDRLGPEQGAAWRQINIGGWQGVIPEFQKEVLKSMVTAVGDGTKEHPWQLKTPPNTSGYQMWRDETADPPALVCQVGATQLRYYLRCIDDLHAMLKARGDWMPLGGTDEQKEAPPDSVEAWGRSPDNPVKGWYGLKKGLRGRFGVYVPPLLEALGLAEVEHNARNNRMRAI